MTKDHPDEPRDLYVLVHLCHPFEFVQFSCGGPTQPCISALMMNFSLKAISPIYKAFQNRIGWVGICLLLALFCSSAVHAQQGFSKDTSSLEDVVITGQYSPSIAAKAVQRIIIIDRKKIDALAAQNLRDVMTNQLNVRLSQDNILGSSLNLQGVSGQNVKILQDGVPVVGRQDGNIDLSQINLQNIERIEIIEGPMSVTYGSDALAGTINLITRKTQQRRMEVGATGYYESIGVYNLNGRVGYQKGRHQLQLNGGRNYFDGWNTAETPSFNFAPKMADSTRFMLWKPKEQYVAGLQYGYAVKGMTYGFRSSFFNEKIVNKGLPGYKMQQANDDYYRTNRFDNVLSANGKLNSRYNLSAHIAYNIFERVKTSYINKLTTLDEILDANPGAQDTTHIHAINSRAALSSNLPNSPLQYELGYEINVAEMNSNRLSGGEQKMGEYAAYASAEYKPTERLTLRPGLRYAYNTRYNAPLVPSLNFRYQLQEGLTARVSYARGFRAPDLKELYFYFVDANHNILGNENLEAETGDNYNASLAYTCRTLKTKWDLGFSGFYNDIAHKIDLVQVAGGGPTDYKYTNISRFKSLGGNVTAGFIKQDYSLTAGFSYIGRYSDFSQAALTQKFLFSPEVSMNASCIIPGSNVRAALFSKYSGATQNFVSDSSGSISRVGLKAYTIADFTLSKSFQEKKLTITVGSKNIFDVQNLNSIGSGTVPVNGLPAAHSNTNGSRSIATGRSFFIKLDVALSSDK